MKYDDASWHSGGNFPADLPPSAGATHIGMFLAWAVIAGLGGDVHEQGDVSKLRSREITPGEFLLSACDGKLTDEDLGDEGNAFCVAYFKFDRGSYLTDYECEVGGSYPSLYHIPDTWDVFDKLAPVLDRRLREWRNDA